MDKFTMTKTITTMINDCVDKETTKEELNCSFEEAVKYIEKNHLKRKLDNFNKYLDPIYSCWEEIRDKDKKGKSVVVRIKLEQDLGLTF